MGKLKTKSGVAKRFKITASGKILKKKAYARHNMSGKSKQRKRNLRRQGVLNSMQAKIIKKLIHF